MISIACERNRRRYDPSIISLDIETYGIAERDHLGRPLPEQTAFHPKKCLAIDGIGHERLIQTVAITVPKRDPRAPGQPWDRDLLAQLEPGESIFFRFWNPEDRAKLATWLRFADTILGANIQFDLSFLRHHSAEFRLALGSFRHTLVDLPILIYLDSELHDSRSLKDIGPVIGTHCYQQTEDLSERRFASSDCDEVRLYNCRDTHRTMLAIAELARRIGETHHDSDKLTPYSTRFYSDTLHVIVAMSEAGVAMDQAGLESYHQTLKATIERTRADAESLGLRIAGKNSERPMEEWIARLVGTYGQDLLDAGQIEITPAERKISLKDSNRQAIAPRIPPDSVDAQLMAIVNEHATSHKLLSAYTAPLLDRKVGSKSKKPFASRLVERPRNGAIGTHVAYPTWYAVPSKFRDNSEGGTIQARVTASDPGIQTFPPAIKRFLRSRFVDGCLFHFDLSQIELRVAALLSGEPSLIDFYLRGGDLHTDRAITTFGREFLLSVMDEIRGLPISEWRKCKRFDEEFRQVGKMVNFADLYRSSAETMQAQIFAKSGIRVSLSILQQAVTDRQFLRPVLWAWQESLVRQVGKDAILRIPIVGQSRYYAGNVRKHVNEIVNQPVQTTAGNVLLAIQHELLRLLPDRDYHWGAPLMTHQVYDAATVDCPYGTEPIVRAALDEAVGKVASPTGYWGMLERMTGRHVPLKFDAKAA